MSQITEVKVPDIGEFKNVDIIEVHVAPGDTVNIEDPLITLESDKATMEVPAPLAGVVEAVKVKVGGKVTEGSVILTLKARAKTAGASTPGTTKDASPAPPAPAPAKTPAAAASGDVHAELGSLFCSRHRSRR